MRSDRAPDLGDPVMMVMFGGSIVVYAALSLICMVTTITARSRERKGGSRDGRGVLRGGRGYGNDDENRSLAGGVGLNPALAGMLIGFSMFLWQWAIKN